jgi:uncharacterized protein YcbK (DUF882 family)
MTYPMPTTRRKLLIGGLATAACSVARSAPAASRLKLYHIHTAESLDVTYRERGVPIPSALTEINHLLRDFRNGSEVDIDIALLDGLSALYDRFGQRGHYEIISGFRSPRTNAALRRVTTGVAENSLHMYGQAADVRLIGTTLTDLRDAALELEIGGVGFYPDSNFVHIDMGRVRRW